jgi:hypothetical protein
MKIRVLLVLLQTPARNPEIRAKPADLAILEAPRHNGTSIENRESAAEKPCASRALRTESEPHSLRIVD